MVAAGRANGMPSESSMELLCARPMPSSTRPPAISLSVRACAASIRGWRSQIGMTAVPSSMVLVAPATTASAVSASGTASCAAQ